MFSLYFFPRFFLYTDCFNFFKKGIILKAVLFYIGNIHDRFHRQETQLLDDSFYLLTLAAVAKELKRRGLAEAKVFLAVGLPLTRFGAEKNDFIKYLTKNKRVSFKYENESYHIEIDNWKNR